MLVVGLTGGIASGKSFVSKRLVELGANIVDADQIAREIVQPGQPAWQEIIAHFGRDIVQASGAIDRKALGEIIFNNPESRSVLEQITHPKILERVNQRIVTYKELAETKLIVVDAPLLIESGAHQKVDSIWLVYCSLEEQVRRLMARDKLQRGQALARINAQMPLQEKLRYAQEVICTDGTPENTIEQVEKLWDKYIKK